MTVLEAMAERYSYRGVFLPQPVPREDLRSILEAGLAVPSGCNSQTTSLIGIDEPALAQKLGETLGHGHFATAPAAVIVLTQRLSRYGDTFYNVQDYAAAIENMLLAITGLGYASCWVEGEVTGNPKKQAEIAKLFGIPEGYTAVACLPVGVPEKPGRRPQKRAFAERCSFNGFDMKRL